MLLACAYWNQKAVWIWKFDPSVADEHMKPMSKLVHVLKPMSKLIHVREVQSCQFRKTLGVGYHGDADVLLTACVAYSLRMWDVDNSRVIRILQNNASHFTTCDFSFHVSSCVLMLLLGALALPLFINLSHFDSV